MKFKTTKKAVMDGYSFVIETGYCSVYDLLSAENPIAYTCGLYGWNADIYAFDDVAIVTGYRPFGRLKINHETVERYKKAAEEIKKANRYFDYANMRTLLRALISDFIDTVKKENGIM